MLDTILYQCIGEISVYLCIWEEVFNLRERKEMFVFRVLYPLEKSFEFQQICVWSRDNKAPLWLKDSSYFFNKSIGVRDISNSY